ncbi:MAG: DUF4783 domain-containing protein [Chitinophagaceae bacterium]|nr:DUF4783 domain-containing protein [Chitinophagaceae bacterium]
MMKTFFLALTFFLSTTAFSQSAASEIIQAFRSGNAGKVSAYFDNLLEITFDKTNKEYSKSEAAAFISGFFSDNSVRDFKVLHQSGSSGSFYCIGNLITSSGTYRTTFFAKEKGGRTVLQEIRFEK